MDSSFDPNGGKVWIGRHSADGDTLVYDPSQGESGSSYVSLFSLTQFRPRTFPRRVVEEKIVPVTDASEQAEALERYRSWPSLKAEVERESQTEREAGAGRTRESILAHHKAYLESRGIPYRGVRDSSAAAPAGAPAKRARTVCGNCGIRLDDFVGVRCEGCSGVLCSCGACACVGTPRPAV